MSQEIQKSGGHVSPFEKIKRVNATGNEYWSSRDFAGYSDSITVTMPGFSVGKTESIFGASGSKAASSLD